jgi:glycerophosphoryl diester phosphodiesterase
VPAREHIHRHIDVVGHAGLAIQRAGGAPTRRHLDEAMALGLDRIEIDVCSSADGRLVVRHDTALPDGRFVADVDLAGLRSDDPELLTLDDICEQLGDRIPMLLDVKMAHAAQALGPWLRRRRDLDQFALCTENLPWLLHLRFAAPRVARWPSFPDIGDHSAHHVQRVLAGLWRSHASLGGLRRGVSDVHHVARHLRHRPQESIARLAGLPWRARLPFDLAVHCREIGAEGICVQKWLISGALVEEAHRAGLDVNTWTVNDPDIAQTVAVAGVDSITTDRVAALRLALGMGRPPRLPAAGGSPRLRAAGRSAPS